MSDSVQNILNAIRDRTLRQQLNILFRRILPGDAEITAVARSLSPNENGRTFYLDSATEFATALPLPFIGAHYTFIVRTAPSGASYTVVATSGIIKGLQNSVAGDAGDSGTADTTITFVDGQSVAGDKCEVYSDGVSWFAYAISKVAAGVTFS